MVLSTLVHKNSILLWGKIKCSFELFYLGEIGLDSTSSGQGPVAGCCECGDEPLGFCAMELVSYELF
jgi:hypothetical protein